MGYLLVQDLFHQPYEYLSLLANFTGFFKMIEHANRCFGTGNGSFRTFKYDFFLRFLPNL